MKKSRWRKKTKKRIRSWRNRPIEIHSRRFRKLERLFYFAESQQKLPGAIATAKPDLVLNWMRVNRAAGLEAAKRNSHESLEPDVCLFSVHRIPQVIIDCATETENYRSCSVAAVWRAPFATAVRG